MKIITKYDPPPIPIWENFAWSAVSEDYDLGSPIGFGKTEAEAIEDLKEQYEARS